MTLAPDENTLATKGLMLEVRRGSLNEQGWCVALNGTDVVAFIGPDARNRAEHHKDELEFLLSARSQFRLPRSDSDR